MAESQDLKPLLLETDDEFRQLATKHHELEERLHELTSKHYLSGPEQVEEITLKKRKLQLKDKMEEILRRYRQHPPLGSESVAQPPAGVIAGRSSTAPNGAHDTHIERPRQPAPPAGLPAVCFLPDPMP